MSRKRILSLVVAAAAFVVLSLAAHGVLAGMNSRYRLESRNDMETTFSILFASLRDYDSFGEAIEANPRLRDKVVGVGVYNASGTSRYIWGNAPSTFDSPPPGNSDADPSGDVTRWYIENPKRDSVTLLLMPYRQKKIPPPPPEEAGVPKERRGHPFMFETLRDANILFLEIRQPQYWKRQRVLAVSFPIVEILLALAILAVRLLILKNSEYRNRIEEQKNLVVLGTAASTLAHEIKNPLSAIRLQTTILSKTLGEDGRRELEIIDSEVQRLSALVNRIGDYLRDPAGNPTILNPADIAREVSQRMCGRNLVRADGRATSVRMDPERLRSVLENLLRNALESGGDESLAEIEVTEADARVRIDVLDRGTGVAPSARERLMEPFFTTKSRGSGIGLSICRRFAEAAQGSISLEDREGGGARARLSLPVCHAGGDSGGER